MRERFRTLATPYPKLTRNVLGDDFIVSRLDWDRIEAFRKRVAVIAHLPQTNVLTQDRLIAALRDLDLKAGNEPT